MSGAPKRPHEDSSYSSAKHHHDGSVTHPKLSTTVSSDYHNSCDVGQDSMVAKVPRTESRDGDRRSPLHVGYRASSSSNDLHVVHPVSSESRLDSRDPKDIGDHQFENRDNNKRDLYGEARRESQNPKSDKESRIENRGEDNKGSRYDRDSHNEPKVDLKTEKDSYLMTSSQSWKEAKEYFRGKRYSEPAGATVDSWHNSRGNTQNSVEVGKKNPNAEEEDHVESHENVGENKLELKSDDKFKDEDRKRKDLKHTEWVEKDKERNDCRSGNQVANSSGEYKESNKDEKDADRWESDRKDPSKEKGNLKEKEKDDIKREPWNGVDKEDPHNEKESVDVSIRVSEHQIAMSEQKKQKEFDSWKNIDKEVRERKKERDANSEGDKLDKHSKSREKESDYGCADAKGVMEKEKEVRNYGVQQRKRMQRYRGSPQVGNRDPRFRSPNQDSEGSQGKLDVAYVVYRVGDCMQELIKLWKEHESSQVEKNDEISNSGPTLEIWIPAEHVTATNRQVRGGQLWGTDVYTYDSDLVAVLMHTGYCRPTASPPPAAIQELRVTIRVLPPQDCYISTLRNNVRSRAWGAAIGCSYRVDHCCIVKKGGGTIDLEPCLTHTSTVEPTLAPIAMERTMTTRAAASNALRQQRFVREVTIQYSLCNEPWIKYSISIVADKGLKKPLYTSARLKKGEVLYLETHSCRYELCFTGEKMVKTTPATQLHESDVDKPQNHHPHAANGERNECDSVMVDVFRWSRCKKPLPQKVMRSVGIPLPLEHVEVLEENLDWEDIQWSQTGVWIAGKEYNLLRVHFLSMN